jgi:glycosyltransferase involved in cell wall biosynthesis
MKILLTSIVDLKKSQHNRPHQFVKYLSKKHEITVLSINDWWKGRQEDMKSYSRDFDDDFNRIEYHHLTDKKTSPILQEVFSRSKVNEIIGKNDFDVHLNYSTLVSGYYAAKKLNTVYDIADDLGAMIKASPQIPAFLRGAGGAFGDMMIRKNIDISSKITLTTDVLRKAYNIPEQKSEIIPNGVDTEMFRDYGSNAKAELGLDGFILGYVGVLREWIDFEPIFSIMKEMDKSIKMLIVGKEGKFRENQELARRYGIEDRVIFAGMVPYSSVPKYISAMDVCLMPFNKGTISESAVPLKLFEYMACEKPVISTRLSGIESVAGDRIKYASNREEYIERIRVLFEDDNLRKKLGREGRKFVMEHYTWGQIAGRMEKIMLEVNNNKLKINGA